MNALADFTFLTKETNLHRKAQARAHLLASARWSESGTCSLLEEDHGGGDRLLGATLSPDPAGRPVKVAA